MSVRQESRRDPVTGERRSFWIVDLCVRQADGSETRIRRVPRIQSRRGAEQLERELLSQGPVKWSAEKKEGQREKLETRKEDANRLTTVKAFATDFLEKYTVANNKPSEVQGKRMIFSLHLVPAMGSLRLDQVGAQVIEAYKAAKLQTGLSPKTVNNHLIVLRRMLGVAMERGLLDRVPVVKWLKVPEAEFDFLDFGEAERLLSATEGEWRTMILLAIKTGLRQGELIALRWTDLDLVAGYLVVRQSATRGI